MLIHEYTNMMIRDTEANAILLVISRDGESQHHAEKKHLYLVSQTDEKVGCV